MNSIRTRLTLAFLGLAGIPLLVVGLILIGQSYRAQTQEAIFLQRETVARLSSQVLSFFEGQESQLQILIQVGDLPHLPHDRQELLLSIFHARQSSIDRLFLMDTGGRILVDHSRVNLHQDPPFPGKKDFELLLPALSRGETYYSPVRIDALSGEPLMQMAIPIVELKTGKLDGMLVADLRLKAVWDLVAGIRPGKMGASFITGPDYRIIAHSNPSVVLRETRFAQPLADGIQRSQSGEQVVLVSQDIAVGSQHFRVFVENPVSEALALTRQTVRIMLIIVAFVLLLSGGLGILMVGQIVRPIEDIAASARAINAGDLSNRVIVKSRDELGVLASAFNGMTAQLESLIKDLENRVAERTTKLATANKELEAFSYTVSHDLRAPLRHINGYVDLLSASCSADLGEKGLHYLNTIAFSARQMGELIDDLLSFSRVGRIELRQEDVDMNLVLQEALTLAQEACVGRNVEWSIGKLPMVRGDSILLRQVWANLLGNAVKFTQSKEAARIEVGCFEATGGIVFFVADNGVGFEMEYASKLFEVFQRLHQDAEYEGTGIGLAIVRRIIERHGGRAWAEGVLGSGAKFLFMLPA